MIKAKKRDYTTKEVKRIIEMFEQGYTQVETGKELNRHPGSIANIWKANGLFRRVRITPKLEIKLRTMNDKGLTYAAMSCDIGVCELTIKRFFKKLGIKKVAA